MCSNMSTKTNLNLSSIMASNLSETSVISNDDFEYNDFASSNNG